MILYADDTVIFEKDLGRLQELLNLTYDWCENNLLTINCKKSQWMKTKIINKNSHYDNDRLFLGTSILERVQEYKYLGINMDSEMSFHQQREILHKKLNYKITLFRKIMKYINVDAALTIYKGTILPIIEYADFICDQDIAYFNKKLQKFQNQSLYIVYNQHILSYLCRDSTETLHRSANMYRLFIADVCTYSVLHSLCLKMLVCWIEGIYIDINMMGIYS